MQTVAVCQCHIVGGASAEGVRVMMLGRLFGPESEGI